MKTLHVMSIIGLILFSFSFLMVLAFIVNDPEAALGWAIIALFYAIPFSIVGMIKAK